jgi:Cu+-exporting ATPase
MDRSKIYQLGVAGFCFSNIMLLSFPEYLGLAGAEKSLQVVFRWLSLLLATPVFLYSSYPFFSSGWSGLKNKYLNIDAPIALAILVTYCRSVYEVVSGTGSGYFDSMTGIVFFMLVGRILQDKTYQQLSFERDYTSYFPIAVTVLKEGKEVPVALPDIRPGDTLLIHHEELIPADGILTRGKGAIDYSFVTGESIPVVKDMGEIVYAGGKQTLATIELLVIKEVAQSYLTRLWSGEQFNKQAEDKQHSFVNLLSRYFTLVLFAIALLATIYWGFHDSRMVWNVLTAVLIVACPCALLLSNTFTNGNILRILGRNHLYLRNAQAIENIAAIEYIVFDKTGTLTSAQQQEVSYKGTSLDPDTRRAIALLAGQSGHPLSRVIATYYGSKDTDLAVQGYREIAGKGIEGSVNGNLYALGSEAFISGRPSKDQGLSQVWVSKENEVLGYYQIANHYRRSIPEMIRSLGGRYPIAVASGDHAAERENLSRIFGSKALLLFGQHPQDKLDLIRKLQQEGKKVMMIGDGLNDAGALRQSEVGIAIAENTNTFTPACDAILEAGKLGMLGRFILLCKWNQKVVVAAFLLSIAYNIVGLSFAVQGLLSPLTAAILMPASSISIVLITFGGTNLIARLQKL